MSAPFNLDVAIENFERLTSQPYSLQPTRYIVHPDVYKKVREHQSQVGHPKLIEQCVECMMILVRG